MSSDLLAGIATACEPSALLFTVVGTILGIVFGALPGLTSTMAVALLIPLTYSLEPVAGMGMLVGAFCGGTAGGSVSATLLKIPGTPSSICTTFDAHPMAMQGKAGLALGTSVLCSFIGGIFSLIALVLIAPQLASVALQFGPLEYFSLAILGLTIIASISSKSMLKGIISGCVGVFAAFVGVDTVTGSNRLTFGSVNLTGGLQLLPVLIGLFAVSQALTDAESFGNSMAEGEVLGGSKIKAEFPKLKEMLENWKIILSSSVLGCLVGILPGAGGSIASFVAYDTAKHISKTPEKFGKGNLQGVMASETSNNAMTGGALVPMMALGIPGDTCTAVMMGGLTIQGLRPGPMLFRSNMDTVYGIFVALLIANIAMFAFQTFGIRVFVKVLKVPRYMLTPFVLVLCTLGSYGLSKNLFDVGVMVFFGIVGYFATKLGYGVAPMVLGFILGGMAEKQFRSATTMYDSAAMLFTRPIACVLLAAAILLVAYPYIKGILNKKKNVV